MGAENGNGHHPVDTKVSVSSVINVESEPRFVPLDPLILAETDSEDNEMLFDIGAESVDPLDDLEQQKEDAERASNKRLADEIDRERRINQSYTDRELEDLADQWLIKGGDPDLNDF